MQYNFQCTYKYRVCPRYNFQYKHFKHETVNQFLSPMHLKQKVEEIDKKSNLFLDQQPITIRWVTNW